MSNKYDERQHAQSVYAEQRYKRMGKGRAQTSKRL